MLFWEQSFFKEVIRKCISDSFLKEVAEKYHYLPQDAPLLKDVSLQMQEVLRKEACVEHVFLAEEKDVRTGVVMTLGEGIDVLQGKYSESGRLTEAYMLEALAAEVLLLAYQAYNNWVKASTRYAVMRYYFPGSEAAYPLGGMAGLLDKMSLPVRCNEAYCLIPKKSVVFYAHLTEDKGVHCRGVCFGCSRKDCPNRMKDERGTRQLLPYGYMRILGKEYL